MIILNNFLLATIRENLGVPSLLNENSNIKDLLLDEDLENIVNNILCLTQRQLDFFFTKLWKKYTSVDIFLKFI